MRRLSPAERRLWRAFSSGAWVDLREGDKELDDPAQAHRWGREREVRAEVIAALLLGAVERTPGQVPGVRLAGARVVGALDLSGASIDATLYLLNCHLAEPVDLSDATAKGVRLRGCELARFKGSRMKVDGLFELDGSAVHAGVRLDNARVEGQCRLSRTTLTAPPPRTTTSESAHGDVREPEDNAGDTMHEWALWAGGLSVGGGAFLRGLRAHGGLRLIGGDFPGGLYLERAHVGAINADFMTAGTAELSAGFRADGTIRMRGARVDGVLSFDRAELRAAGRVLHLSHMQADEVIMRPDVIEGGVNFGYSRFGVLLDSPEAYPDAVQLNGLTYESLRGSWTLTERLGWLCHDPDGYRPQPYEQLASWYRRIGHEPDARRVLLAKQRERRGTLRAPGRMWGRLLDLMVGYGYRSWLAGLWAVILLGAGTVIFGQVPPVQVDPDEVRTFNAFVYSLDLLVPVSVFEVRGAYEPAGWTAWVAWTLVVSGWVLATALIAGATRVLRPAPGA
ncbi:hypothetical protein ACFXJ8_13630 [Nonomuraea sp. NPDC059194]|uniref:hypothetical protein n=1 Tax=Nonomuraea sp. NPDC059194 TaxID=3346764 RepID=UPI0036ABCFE5